MGSQALLQQQSPPLCCSDITLAWQHIGPRPPGYLVSSSMEGADSPDAEEECHPSLPEEASLTLVKAARLLIPGVGGGEGGGGGVRGGGGAGAGAGVRRRRGQGSVVVVHCRIATTVL